MPWPCPEGVVVRDERVAYYSAYSVCPTTLSGCPFGWQQVLPVTDYSGNTSHQGGLARNRQFTTSLVKGLTLIFVRSEEQFCPDHAKIPHMRCLSWLWPLSSCPWEAWPPLHAPLLWTSRTTGRWSGGNSTSTPLHAATRQNYPLNLREKSIWEELNLKLP